MENEARLDVLRVLFRLARLGIPGAPHAIMLRTGGTLPALRRALQGLERSGLVELHGQDSVRLTMTGFAVAVAASAPRRFVRQRAA